MDGVYQARHSSLVREATSATEPEELVQGLSSMISLSSPVVSLMTLNT